MATASRHSIATTGRSSEPSYLSKHFSYVICRHKLVINKSEVSIIGLLDQSFQVGVLKLFRIHCVDENALVAATACFSFCVHTVLL